MISRLRRLLVIPAVGLVLVGAPALALDRPEPPRPTTDEVPLGPTATGGPGAEAVADVHADLVGVKWSGDPDTQFRIEVKRDGGDWEPAGEVGPVDRQRAHRVVETCPY